MPKYNQNQLYYRALCENGDLVLVGFGTKPTPCVQCSDFGNYYLCRYAKSRTTKPVTKDFLFVYLQIFFFSDEFCEINCIFRKSSLQVVDKRRFAR